MPTYVKLVCDYCNKNFERELKEVNRNKKRGHLNLFCSRFCQGKFKTSINTFKTVCENCNKPIIKANNQKHRSRSHFCSPECSCADKMTYSTVTRQVKCKNCNILFHKRTCAIDQSPNHFCSRSCSSTYNAKHKKRGFRRSKLEFYLEDQIRSKMSHILFLVNDRRTIGLELDLYFPDLKLAIEINGPYHYYPIHGDTRLSQTQATDKRKQDACKNAGIDLVIIDNLEHCTAKFANTVWLEVKAILDKFKVGTPRYPSGRPRFVHI